jgi:hypothetical protein
MEDNSEHYVKDDVERDDRDNQEGRAARDGRDSKAQLMGGSETTNRTAEAEMTRRISRWQEEPV